VCGSTNGQSARLHFAVCDDGSVEAHFFGSNLEQGYDGVLHGGVIATVLDAAMTNCLFTLGRGGLTAELSMRFRHPVRTGRGAVVRAWIERDAAPLFVLRAELIQDDRSVATAVGKFMTPVTLPWKRPNR
jgi:acyl-coenzyme A thioesterase PaaI-like protein